MTTQKTFYLNKNGRLVEAQVLRDTPHARDITLLEGEDKNKKITVHPDGVAWGKTFPRLFQTHDEVADVFVVHGRAMLKKNPPKEHHAAVPLENKDYRFQPFLADVIDSIHQGQSVILTGGTGVGKTTHITQLASRIRQPMLRINFNGETRMSDLVGKIHVVNGATKWIDGILPMAMRQGWWLLLDELDFAEPAVLSLLHPVLEDEPMLVLKENNGEIIRPHSNFRLFATANSIGAMSDRAGAYSGTNQMNEAFLDRWQVIMVDNLPMADEIKVLRKEAPGLKPAWAKRIAEFARRVRTGDVNEYTGDNFSTRKSIAWAKKTALHRDPIKGAQLAWLDKMPKNEQEPIQQALKTFFGTGKRTGLGGAKKKKVVSAGVGAGLPRKRGRPKKV